MLYGLVNSTFVHTKKHFKSEALTKVGSQGVKELFLK